MAFNARVMGQPLLKYDMKELNAGDKVTVRVLKYDGSEYRHWQATVSLHEAPLVVLDAQFDMDVQHDDLGLIPRGTRSVEYYWLDKWYNVFRFLNAAGNTSLWYCNINVPPTIEGRTLSYVDLDIDVVVRPDLSYRILDLDEFERHAAIFNYPEAIKDSTHASLADLLQLIERRAFPFDQR